eukprot:CAMPEP_0119117758 /NCGR_PEP_ID=MMETSP1180-20130426/53018_1 /TAXON_ID=3052 ORGANISM="Chlamydomonas cf sp, Strain CCMP681" /NCGR_SAMPLE_ID=MMETSP1180 /ASSEMBLY_ACC=CAM_ASM_000741 /LENGTH=84 /DNA_ID=CAMNT_0007107051 /DNA_START=776 /DNA_END=1030 /DNA_ORIENTATION=+
MRPSKIGTESLLASSSLCVCGLHEASQALLPDQLGPWLLKIKLNHDLHETSTRTVPTLPSLYSSQTQTVASALAKLASHSAYSH